MPDKILVTCEGASVNSRLFVNGQEIPPQCIQSISVDLEATGGAPVVTVELIAVEQFRMEITAEIQPIIRAWPGMIVIEEKIDGRRRFRTEPQPSTPETDHE